MVARRPSAGVEQASDPQTQARRAPSSRLRSWIVCLFTAFRGATTLGPSARLRALRGSVVESSGRFGDELVANAADGQQMPGAHRLLFNRPAQTHDEMVDRPGVGILPQPPDVFQHRLARDDASLV